MQQQQQRQNEKNEINIANSELHQTIQHPEQMNENWNLRPFRLNGVESMNHTHTHIRMHIVICDDYSIFRPSCLKCIISFMIRPLTNVYLLIALKAENK